MHEGLDGVEGPRGLEGPKGESLSPEQAAKIFAVLEECRPPNRNTPMFPPNVLLFVSVISLLIFLVLYAIR